MFAPLTSCSTTTPCTEPPTFCTTLSSLREMSSSPKSRSMAFTVVSAATLAICGLYYAGLKSKSEKQQESIYKQGDRPLSDSDVSKNSTQVREAMHKTRGA